MAPAKITHTLATEHHPQICAAQPGFVQWTLLSSMAGSSRGRKDMPCFDAGREERMYECPEQIQEQIVDSLSFLFPFIFSVYTQIGPIKKKCS